MALVKASYVVCDICGEKIPSYKRLCLDGTLNVKVKEYITDPSLTDRAHTKKMKMDICFDCRMLMMTWIRQQKSKLRGGGS